MESCQVPLGKPAKLEQLAEECSELAKAALKLARIYRKENPTPITEQEALENLSEEVADVTLCIRVLGDVIGCNVEQIISKKHKRWMERLSKLPVADVAPVVRGRWTTPRGIIECSKCGFGMFPDGYFFEFGECVHANESQYRPNFCPNCGAKCDLEE